MINPAPSSFHAAPGPGLARTYRADGFTLDVHPDWTDKTVFVLEGPNEHGLQHNLTINVDRKADAIGLIDYADVHIENQLETLRGCRLLKKGLTRLDNEMPAYRAIFVWYPTDERRIYQDQLFVLHDGVGYKLIAHFTKKTRKTIGPSVERAMRSFEPMENE